MCGSVVGINHVRPWRFTRGNFTQQSGSHAQGHRNKNIFCELASQEWELGMCTVVAEKVGVRLGLNCPRLQEGTSLVMPFPDYAFFFSFFFFSFFFFLN